MHFSKLNLSQIKVMAFGGLLSFWSTIAFWIPVKPLHLRVSANWWDAPKTAIPAAGIGQQKGPSSSMTMLDCMSHNQCFSSWTNCATRFCLICHIHQPLANWLTHLQALQQLFAGKTLPQPAGGRKCFPRVHWILKHGFFYCTGINQLISCWPKCVDCCGYYFD